VCVDVAGRPPNSHQPVQRLEERNRLHLMNLEDYNDVVRHADEIFDRVKRGFYDPDRMPPPPRREWGPSRVDLFQAWMIGGFLR